jgi:monooxygenase
MSTEPMDPATALASREPGTPATPGVRPPERPLEHVDVLIVGAGLSDTVTYKGMMLCGVPNMAYAVGYTNASWTLKCDLVAQYVCRVLNHMEKHGYREYTPRAPDSSLPIEPMVDFSSGYVLRSIDNLPKQGGRAPWRLHQNYARDVLLLKHGALEDEGVSFSKARAAAPAPERLAA